MSVLDKLVKPRPTEEWTGRYVILSVLDDSVDHRIGSREKFTYHAHGEGSIEDARRSRDYAMTYYCGNEDRRWIIAEIVETIDDQPRTYNQETGNNGYAPYGAL